MDSYIEQEYVCEDLAEALIEDFTGWDEELFKRIDTLTQRRLRDHILWNGIKIVKRKGYPVAQAVYECLNASEESPFVLSENIKFTRF